MAEPLHILIVDDEPVVHDALGDYLTKLGHHVDGAGDAAQALEQIERRAPDLALVDVRMPGMDGLALLGRIWEVSPEIECVIITGHADLDAAVEALRAGAADFLRKPIRLQELDGVLERAARLRELLHERRRLRSSIARLQARERVDETTREFRGTSAAAHRVREQISLAVEGGCDTILVTGETGAGKEVVARQIHFSSGPADSPFIAVSCPALPDSLVEGELFGHEKGAFTGAVEDRLGCFELADGGTLFLDEVGDLSAAAQAALLRVLETRSFRRVGGSREVRVHVRVVAASNAPLDLLVAAGRLRGDLLHRLRVFVIHVPPLRERPEDIIPLAEHFLALLREARGYQCRGLSSAAENALLGYSFPGNGRELRNIIERAAILCRCGEIDLQHLHLDLSPVPLPAPASEEQYRETERARLLRVLEQSGWNRRQAARELGIPPSTLRYRLKRLGLQ